MSLANLGEILAGQGTLFWIAAAIIAAGGTLLVTAIALEFKRRTMRRGPVRRDNENTTPSILRRRRKAKTPAPEPAEALPDPTAARRAYAGTLPTPALNALLDRLQRAGDRLETVSGLLAETADSDSSLKTSPGSVEYVYKANG